MDYERWDDTEEWEKEKLEVGKTYRMAIAHGGYFTHYWTVRIHSVHEQMGDTYSYGVSGDTNGYLWAVPSWRNICQRIVKAEEVV